MTFEISCFQHHTEQMQARCTCDRREVNRETSFETFRPSNSMCGIPFTRASRISAEQFSCTVSPTIPPLQVLYLDVFGWSSAAQAGELLQAVLPASTSAEAQAHRHQISSAASDSHAAFSEARHGELASEKAQSESKTVRPTLPAPMCPFCRPEAKTSRSRRPKQQLSQLQQLCLSLVCKKRSDGNAMRPQGMVEYADSGQPKVHRPEDSGWLRKKPKVSSLLDRASNISRQFDGIHVQHRLSSLF